MSTEPPALFTGLVDDAAVFPPGNAPLPVAVSRHRAHRRSSYAALVGPLLVPAADADALVAAAGQEPGDVLEVALVARPGVDPGVLVAAVGRLAHEPSVHVVGAELGWFAGWRDLAVDGLPLTLEVPRGADQDRALDDVAAAVDEVGRPVQAKFRTGATPAWEWPDEAELAAFLHDCSGLGVPFKLTGGLHHVVRADHDDGPEHGLLNVLLAVRAAVHDRTPGTIESVLAERDAHLLTDAVSELDEADVRRVRSLFTAYGCCEVTDPIGELRHLDLLDLDDVHPEENPS